MTCKHFTIDNFLDWYLFGVGECSLHKKAVGNLNECDDWERRQVRYYTIIDFGTREEMKRKALELYKQGKIKEHMIFRPKETKFWELGVIKNELWEDQ